MARYQNPFVSGPWNSGPSIGAGLNSWAKVLAPDPSDLAGIANARLATARAAGVEASNEGWASVAPYVQTVDGSPASMVGMLARLAATRDPQVLSAAGGWNQAIGGALGVDGARMDQLARGAGRPYDSTEASFRQTDATRRYGYDSSAGATRYSADAAAGASRYNTDQREAGADRRDLRRDLSLNPNEIVYVSPERREAMGLPASPVRGAERPATRDQAIAGEVPNYLNPPPGEDPAVTARRREVVAPSVVGAEIRGRQRIEQIQLQGQQAIDLQTLRGEQAAGRLDTQGQQRLQQLETQNAAAMERVQAQQQGAMDRAQLAVDSRPPLDISPAEAEKARFNMLALLGDTADNNGAPTGGVVVGPDAQAWLQRRWSQIYQETRDAGGAAAQAAEELRAAWLKANPGVALPRADQTQGWFARSRVQMGLPPGLPVPAVGLPRPTRTPPAAQQRQTFRLTPAEVEQALAEARDAISKNVPREVVIERLQGSGIDPSRL